MGLSGNIGGGERGPKKQNRQENLFTETNIIPFFSGNPLLWSNSYFFAGNIVVIIFMIGFRAPTKIEKVITSLFLFPLFLSPLLLFPLKAGKGGSGGNSFF